MKIMKLKSLLENPKKPIIKERLSDMDVKGEKAEQTLFKIKKKFINDFEDYVDLYSTVAAEDTESSPNQRREIQKFAKELESVLFKLKHGEI